MAKKKKNPWARNYKTASATSGFNSGSEWIRQLRDTQQQRAGQIQHFYGDPVNDYEKGYLKDKISKDFTYFLQSISQQNDRENAYTMKQLDRGTTKSQEAKARKKVNEEQHKEHEGWFEKRFNDVKGAVGDAAHPAKVGISQGLDKVTPDYLEDGVKKIGGGAGWAFDKLARPLYGVNNAQKEQADLATRVREHMSDKEWSEYQKTGRLPKFSKKQKEEMLRDFKPGQAFKKGFTGKEKTTGADILAEQLKTASPEVQRTFSKNPVLSGFAGLSTDITNDPLTFLGVGGGRNVVKAAKEFADDIPELRNLSKNIAGYKIPKEGLKDTKLASFLDNTDDHLTEDEIYGILGGRVPKSYRTAKQKARTIKGVQDNINVLENHLRRVDIDPNSVQEVQDAKKQLDLIRSAHSKLKARRGEVAEHGSSDIFADEVSRVTGKDATDIAHITEHSDLAEAIRNSGIRAGRAEHVDTKYPSYVARQKAFNSRQIAEGRSPKKIMSKEEWLDEHPDLETSLGKTFAEHPHLTPEDRSGLLKEVRADMWKRDDEFGKTWQAKQKLVRQLREQREPDLFAVRNLEGKPRLNPQESRRLSEARRNLAKHNTVLNREYEAINSLEATALSRAIRNRITSNVTGIKSYRNPARLSGLRNLEARIQSGRTEAEDAYYTGVKGERSEDAINEPLTLPDDLDDPSILEANDQFMTKNQHYDAIQQAIAKERSALESPVGDVEMSRMSDVPDALKTKDGKLKAGIFQTEKNPDGFVQWDENNQRLFASWAQFKKVMGREITDPEKSWIKNFVANVNQDAKSRVGKSATNATRETREKSLDLREGFQWEQVLKGHGKASDVRLAKEISKVFKKVPGTDKYSPFLKLDGENVFLNGKGFRQSMAKHVTEADTNESNAFMDLLGRLNREPGLEDYTIPNGIKQALHDAGYPPVPARENDFRAWLATTARKGKFKNPHGLSPEHLAFYRKFSETTNYRVGYVKGMKNKILYGKEHLTGTSKVKAAKDSIAELEKMDEWTSSGAAAKHGQLTEELNKQSAKSVAPREAAQESFLDMANRIDELKVWPRDPLDYGTGKSLSSSVAAVKKANKTAYREQIADLKASKVGKTPDELKGIDGQIKMLQREEKRMEAKLAEAEAKAGQAHKALSKQMVDDGLMQVIARNIEPDQRSLYLKTWGDIELFRIPGSRAMFKTGSWLNSPEFLTKSVDIFRRARGSSHVGEQVKFTDPIRKLFGSSAHIDPDLQLARARYQNQTSTIVAIHMDEVRNSHLAEMDVKDRKSLFSGMKKGVTPDTVEAENIRKFMNDFNKYLDNKYPVGSTYLTVDDIAKYLPEYLSIGRKELEHFINQSPGNSQEFAKILGTGEMGSKAKASDPIEVIWHTRIAVEQALAHKAFAESINDTFGVKRIGSAEFGVGDKYKSRAAVDAVNDLEKKGWKSIPELGSSHLFPPEMHRDLTKLVDILKPRNVGKYLNAYDDMTKAWKVLATIYNPGYYSRNFIGETMTGWFGGVNNPAYYRRSAKVIRYINGGESKKLEGFLSQNAWDKHMYSGQFNSGEEIAKLANGTKLTLADVAVLYQDSGLKAGFVNTTLRENDTALRGGLAARRHLLTRVPAKVHGKLKSAGEIGEDFPRLAHFLHGLEHAPRSFSPERAAQYAAEQVRKYHFDYSDVTQFEKAVMMRVIPFYKWTRKAMPLMAGMLLEKPGKIAAYPKLMHNISMQSDPEQEANGFAPSYDPGTPDYLKDAFSYGLGFDDEGKQTRLGIQTPQTDALKALFDPVGTSWMMTNPLIKGTAEQIQGASFNNYDSDGYSNLGERATGIAQYQPALKLLAKKFNRKDSVGTDNGHMDEAMLSFLSGLNFLEDTGYDPRSRSHTPYKR